MDYLRKYNDHSDYQADSDKPTISVSYCVTQDEVHYDDERTQCLPENAQSWALYQSLICDNAILARDLNNIFSKYEVSYSEGEYEGKDWPTGDPVLMYTDECHFFGYNADGGSYWARVPISRTVEPGYEQYAKRTVTNGCGQQVLDGFLGDFEWVYVGK